MIEELLADACSIAQEYNFDQLEPEHLIYAMLTNPEWSGLLSEMGFNTTDLSSNLLGTLRFHKQREPIPAEQLTVSRQVSLAIEGKDTVGPLLVTSLIGQMRDRVEKMRQDRTGSGRSFEDTAALDAPLPDLDELLDGLEQEQAFFGFDRICDNVFQRENRAEKGRSGSFDPDLSGTIDELRSGETAPRKAETPTEKPTLSAKERAEAQRAVERSIRDLTQLYWTGGLDRVIGRDAEIDQICEVLMRRRKSNVLLVGDPGVGKTALMEGVAARVATSKDPALSSRPVLQASLGALVSGARYRGDFEVRMELLIELAQNRQAILFFDEMQMLIGSGATAERGMDGANLLKPALARDGLSLVGATTHEEAAGIRSDAALMRRFETVLVREPGPALMQEILTGAAAPYLAHHRVRANDRTLSRLVDFADRYLQDRRFPDKAFDLLDTACVRARLSGRSLLRVEDIRDAVRRLGGSLPMPQSVDRMAQDHLMDQIRGGLTELVGGHADAVRRVAEAMSARPPGKPIGFHLVGPNGVGRRTLARALGRVMGLLITEISAGYGVEQIREGLIGALSSGPDRLILLNLESDLDRASAALIEGILMNGVIRSASGQEIGLGNTVLCIRSNGHKETIGFHSSQNRYAVDTLDIQKIEMPIFSNNRMVEAVQFELSRLSRMWSDIGCSRPVPSAETAINKGGLGEATWADVVKLCRMAVQD
jgi:ATP-dependent Clp protease ATP-binding subunit ClpA